MSSLQKCLSRISAHFLIERTYCTAQGILLDVMRQPGREGNLGKNGYMYRYGWVVHLKLSHLVNQL